MLVNPLVLANLFVETPFQQPEDSFGFLLWRVAHRYQRDIDRACAQVNLTHLQFVLLVMSAWLNRLGKPVTQPELVEFSSIHPMQVSNVLKALEEKKLLVRPRNAADVRSKQVAVTQAGVDVLLNALPLVKEVQRQFLRQDEALDHQLQVTLRQIIANWGEDK